MSSELQETVNAAGKMLDEIDPDRQLDSGGKQMKSVAEEGQVPEEPSPPTSSHPKAAVSNVLSQLEQMIISDDWAGGAKTPVDHARRRKYLPKLNELGRSIVTSYSLKAYIDLLSVQHRQNIATWLYSNTVSAISNLFKYTDAAVYFHEDSLRPGILHVAKIALQQRYPEMAQNGFRELADKPPVVYLSPACHYSDLAQQFAVQLGVSEVVTVSSMAGSLSPIEGRLDHVELERRLKEDREAGKVPLMVVAVVGSSLLGQNDLVSCLLELRKEYGFWLHVIGLGLAALALKEPPEQLVKVLQSVDSMSVPLAHWLGVQAVNSVTLYHPPGGGDFRLSYQQRVDSLPWWVVTQHLTSLKMTGSIEYAYHLSKVMLKGLAGFHQIELIGIANSADYHSKVERNALLPPTVIAFKYRSALLFENAEQDALTQEQAEYLDCLNAWLAQGLIGECPNVGLHLAEFRAEQGLIHTALRYCPLELAPVWNTTPEHISEFLKHLDETIGILDATVRARRRLRDLVEVLGPCLLQLPVQKWAGAGAVCFVPSIVRDTPHEQWNEKQAQQVSHLNIELVHALRSSDSAFSVGESLKGVACVKFGMLADEKDIDDLVKLVAERGKTLEESSQYLESLAEMVRQGIEAANVDLKKENDEKLIHEGVMRQVPVFGSLLNWWSPLPKEAVNIKGRSFDLKTGRVCSTDVLYKHKLQMFSGDAETPLTPVTPITTSQIPHGVPAVEAENSEPNGDAPDHKQ